MLTADGSACGVGESNQARENFKVQQSRVYPWTRGIQDMAAGIAHAAGMFGRREKGAGARRKK
jgi:hypothetical protein